MPLVQVSTNLSNEAVPKDFEKRFSVFLAEAMDKPIERITVAINCGARICNGGDNTSPFMLMSIHAIDRFNKDNNPGYTDKIVEFVHGETKIPGNKIQIIYKDLQPFMAGKGK